MTNPRTFRVRRSVLIHAPRDLVFRYLIDPDRFSKWFGEGSSLEPEPGGAVHIAFPGGSTAVGQVMEISAPESIVFSWSYPEKPEVLPGGSTVEIRLDLEAGGTRVTLVHTLPTEDAAQAHEGGWAYHLARLTASASRDHATNAALPAINAWFEAWEHDGETCRAHLEKAVCDDAIYRDDAAYAAGRAEILDHIRRCHLQMPGSRLARLGPVLSCADQLTCDARLEGPEHPLGDVRLAFEVAPDGRITRATGFFLHAIPFVTEGAAITPEA